MAAETVTKPPRSLCPHCGRFPEKSCVHAENGVTVANYLCPLGHGWIVKWGNA